MSPRVFQLSPSKQHYNFEYSNVQVPPPQESTPSSEEMLTMPSFEQAMPSPEQKDTFPVQGENGEIVGANGSSEMPLGTKKSAPKKAKRVAGQRKRGVKRQNSKSAFTVVATVSESVCEKVRRAKSKSDDSDDCNEPQKKKSRKFTRCPPHMRHLCEVCSKEDCGECNNCL